MNEQLLAEIAKGYWMIEPGYAQGYAPIIHALYAGRFDEVQKLFGAKSKKETRLLRSHSYVITSDFKTIYATEKDGKIVSAFDQAPAGSIAITSFKGAIMKNDYCGSPGTATRSRQMREADAHPNIAGHLILVDSGGGSVDGTLVAAQTVSDLGKPAVTFVDNLMASAAYWIGSSSKEIILSSATDIVGSIGTMVGFRDYQEYMAKNGIKEIEIYATESTEKNLPWRDALKGNEKTMKQSILDPMNEQFIAGVKKNRAGKFNAKKENIFAGATYIGQLAIEAGLADSIGTFNQAVQRVIELATPKQQSNSPQNNSQMKFTFSAALTALVSLFSAKVTEGSDTVSGEVSADQWKELNTKLESVNALQAAKDRLTAELQTANDAKANADAALVTANELTVQLSARSERLQAMIDGKGSNPGALKTDEVSTTTDDAQAAIDALPHNQAVDANPMFNGYKTVKK